MSDAACSDGEGDEEEEKGEEDEDGPALISDAGWAGRERREHLMRW